MDAGRAAPAAARAVPPGPTAQAAGASTRRARRRRADGHKLAWALDRLRAVGCHHSGRAEGPSAATAELRRQVELLRSEVARLGHAVKAAEQAAGRVAAERQAERLAAEQLAELQRTLAEARLLAQGQRLAAELTEEEQRDLDAVKQRAADACADEEQMAAQRRATCDDLREVELDGLELAAEDDAEHREELKKRTPPPCRGRAAGRRPARAGRG